VGVDDGVTASAEGVAAGPGEGAADGVSTTGGDVTAAMDGKGAGNAGAADCATFGIDETSVGSAATGLVMPHPLRTTTPTIAVAHHLRGHFT